MHLPNPAIRRAGVLCYALTVLLTGCAAGTPSAAVPVPPPTSASTAPGSTAGVAPTAETFDGTVVEIAISGGEVDTADERVIVTLNDAVRLVVTSDVADEVHIHGVDETVDLQVGDTVTHDFVASIPGTFEVELEGAGLLLFSLQVQP